MLFWTFLYRVSILTINTSFQKVGLQTERLFIPFLRSQAIIITYQSRSYFSLRSLHYKSVAVSFARHNATVGEKPWRYRLAASSGAKMMLVALWVSLFQLQEMRNRAAGLPVPPAANCESKKEKHQK